MEESKGKLGLPAWVLIGALTGIGVGVFIGEYARILEPLGTAYAQLLSMCVYPYLICSLLHGLGKLDPSTAGRLFKNAWFVYLLAWSVSIASLLLMGAAFPTSSHPAVITAGSGNQGVDLVSLLIPGNPFQDLSRNVVPAIVVFTVLYGVAIQRVKNKDAFLGILDHMKMASVTIWGWVVMVAPLGVFALFASTAGTLAPQALFSLLLYITVFLIGTFLFAFWVLPVMLSHIAPVEYRDLMRELRGAFVLSMVTTLSVVALPFIQRLTEKFARDLGVSDPELPDVVGTNVSLAYPFAQLGNLGVILFFAFCAFYFQAPLTFGGKVLLPVLSLISTIGTPSGTVNAVSFMAGVFHTPESTQNLYVASMTFTRYGQVALSVTGFAFVTLLSTLSFYGKLKVRPFKLVSTLALGFAVLGGTILLLRALEPRLFARPQSAYLEYRLDPDLARGVKASVYRSWADVPQRQDISDGTQVLDRIRRTGVLRVGYDPVVIPFCYFNARGELVGYDVSYMYRLARDMNVRLEFVPSVFENLTEELQARNFDVAASAHYVTEQRLRDLCVSRSHLQSPPALLARSSLAGRLARREDLAALAGLKVACLNSPALLPFAEAIFPGKTLVIVEDYGRMVDDPSLDVAPWSLVQAKAFALAHPGFTAVVPENLGAPFLFAYMMPPGADQLRRYLESWIELKKADGFQEAQYHYWIEGIPKTRRERRWCVIRDVLHWVD